MTEAAVTPGLRANWRQFGLLVLINAFVGSMVGLERTVVPLIAEFDFAVASTTVILSFLIVFGAVKAFANLGAGRLADSWGRKRVLVVGWLFGVPVPLLIIVAPAWEWIVFANLLLGINQGFAWSATVIMKIDLVGRGRRGLAMGLNEFAGYFGVSVMALATGFLAAEFALRPHPFLPGIAIALLGLAFSTVVIRETLPFAQRETEIAGRVDRPQAARRMASFAEVFREGSWRNRTLFGASQAGLVNNLNDAMMWGLVPLFLVGLALSVEQVGIVAAVYPAVWAFAQLGTGALSDRWGRRPLIVVGMWIQAGGIGLLALSTGFPQAVAAAATVGFGTALVYPTLLAAVSDVAHPSWRASALGVYRLWRDLGFVAGALVAGFLADLIAIPVAIGVIGGLTFVAGVVALRAMSETLPQTTPAAPGL